MSNCVYHRTLDGHYYAPPPKYYKMPLTEDDIDLSFCHECLLQPCTMVGTEEEVDVIIEKVLDLIAEDSNLNEHDAAMRCIKIIHKNRWALPRQQNYKRIIYFAMIDKLLPNLLSRANKLVFTTAVVTYLESLLSW